MIICYCRHSPTKTDSPFFRNLWRWIYTFQLAWFVHSMDLISCMYAWVMWDVLLDTWVIWWHVLALLADTSNSKERGELATETAVWSWIAEIVFKFPASCSHASRTHWAHAQAYDHSEYMHHCWFGICQMGIRGKKEKTSASAFMSDNTLRAGHSPIKCPLHLRQVLISGMCCSLCDPTHKHDTKSRRKWCYTFEDFICTSASSDFLIHYLCVLCTNPNPKTLNPKPEKVLWGTYRWQRWKRW
jgi:hypothetical protein